MSIPDDEYSFFVNLAPDEAEWSDREELFEAHGYNFRPRLRKGWTPSWLTTGKSPLHSEDGQLSMTFRTDAYTDDGRFVCIKRVQENDEEIRIAQMLSTPELREDPKNHCVPIIEVIDDPEYDSISYVVMPLLRSANDPPFQYVEEIIDFVNQILEGLVFLHEKGVAHRDCTMRNLLMDADAMYPEGFHPVNNTYKRDYSGPATYLPRSAAGVRYYFADFDTSVHTQGEGPHLVTGERGRDQEPPELSATVPYDPFQLDVFIIGNMLRHEFRYKFTNTEFLQPLIHRMTIMSQALRPTAEDALRDWLEIRDTIPAVHRELRLCPRIEHIPETMTLDTMFSRFCNI